MNRNVPVTRALTVTACLLAMLSYGCGSDPVGDGTTPPPPPPPPQDVLELASGVFSLMEMVFEGDSSNPALSTYPAGMTVQWDPEPTALRMVLLNLAPDDSGPMAGVLVSGSMLLTRADTATTARVSFSGSFTLTNHARSAIAINGSALFTLNGSDSSGNPDSVTGTFTVDGTQYGLVDIIAALTDDGNNDTTFAPLPSMFAIPSQVFQSRTWRYSPVPTSGSWATYSYINISFGADGTTHAVSHPNGDPGFAGFVNWHTVGALQKLDLTDANRQVQYSFDVLEYDRNHLRLRMAWGAETKEWLFSAGTGNLTGVVVNGASSATVDFYVYYPPIAGATVQFGSYASSFVPDTTVAACVTDSAGYYAFSDLNPPGGSVTCVRVVSAGYADQVQILAPHLPQVSPTTNTFLWVSMAPQ